ncbi:MAG: xanthine dehydrogenase family protein molybdopterin-binding subunit [Sphingomonadales bacterium]|nr:xanthine dehydrogenase family protein molybdopterin-binding subunit [Sphingomonadales bacterium]PIX67357.1 MAG: xanthine dehydrogenase [Sphingomonadales bacterium CG_4_10_14_3_um_filter_58_15]NCO48483.1 xanthine dehydrogenase family protein molybdopterin-binding subunit [Sphingomonadales bacterium]NCO99299.1 xanthine dehydrogenase family protein molybdopterin-binding subunit [Sphingomonadales bacterium]NCP27858.1 xanthine dehydrogenase family protein molybdopterin-binding subunit [Sphingomon
MTAHHKMDKADSRNRLDDMAQGLVGSPMDRPDGPLKVSGRATYAHEWDVPDMLYGVLVRATISKGRVTDVASGAIIGKNGVRAVITDDRLLRRPAQGGADEAPPQGSKQVDYFGQPIALVVADTFEQARHGANILGISYEAEGQASFDPEADDTETDTPEDDQFDQGDLDQAMQDAAFTVDQVYHTPGHNSAAMEPHCAIASWEGDKLTLRGSYQMLNFNINELADALHIVPDNIRMLSPYVGGGFGSKLGISPEAVSAAIAAKEIGQPVCVALSRPQVFETTMRRSETRQHVRLACGEDGVLTGIGHECLVSNLPGETFYEPVTQATHFMYGGKHRTLGIEVARVNRTCGGSVRAPGEAVGMQVLENAMDELAEASGIDPVELRRRNVPDRHPEQDIPYSSRRFMEALDEGAKIFEWDKRNKKPGSLREGDWLIGHGMAGAARVNILSEAKAKVTLLADGSAVVETDMTDIGTGTYAILTQIAGEMLGLPADKIETKLGDSDFPAGPGSGGSWGAASTGSAVFLACEDIRKAIAKKLGTDEADLRLADGKAGRGDTARSITEVLDGTPISAVGHIEPGQTLEEMQQATYGSYFAEVAVNAVTGETRVKRMLGVFGAGRILNEKTATSQCYGGMIWGIGSALTEELVFDNRDGHIVNHDLAEYHIPVNLDVPQIEVVLLEERDEWASPIQAKGIGELGICGAAAAVTNAIYNATGIRVRDYPATLDKLLTDLPTD